MTSAKAGGSKYILYAVRCIQNTKVYDRRQGCREILVNNFGDVEVLDFKDYPLPNSCYGDFTHLNYRGAANFSTFFDRLLKGNILGKKGKQLFIDEKIKSAREDLAGKNGKGY